MDRSALTTSSPLPPGMRRSTTAHSGESSVRQSHRLLGARCGAHLVAAVAEGAGHPLAEVLVVVDQEHGERGHDAGTSGTVSRARVPRAGLETRLRSPPSCSARLRATNSPSPEPVARAAGAEERLAGPGQHLGRHARAPVLHLDPQPVAVEPETQENRHARRARPAARCGPAPARSGPPRGPAARRWPARTPSCTSTRHAVRLVEPLERLVEQQRHRPRVERLAGRLAGLGGHPGQRLAAARDLLPDESRVLGGLGQRRPAGAPARVRPRRWWTEGTRARGQSPRRAWRARRAGPAARPARAHGPAPPRDRPARGGPAARRRPASRRRARRRPTSRGGAAASARRGPAPRRRSRARAGRASRSRPAPARAAPR